MSGTMDLSGLNPYLAALMGRWNQVMGIETERLAAMPERDAAAFNEWKQSKDLSQQEAQLSTDIAYQQEHDREENLARARKAEENARLKTREDDRARLNASVDRARTQALSVPTAVPFNPSGAVADYYEYGAGNPEGRGGGGSAGSRLSDKVGGVGSPEWSAMGLRNCMSDPASPGCPEILAQAMAAGQL